METHYMEKQVFDYDVNPFAIDDTQNDVPPSVHLYEPVQNKFRWHHVEDLDTFFTKIYNYHQKNGFLCMMVEEMFEPIQFLFIVILTFFLLHCINYSQLFRTHKWINHNITQSSNQRNLYLNENSQSPTVHGRMSLWEALEPISVCTQKHYKRTHPFLIICLILASIFLLIRIIRIFQHFFQYWEIRSFYINALKINTNDLPNTTWQNIQTELKRVQKEQRLCIHKAELSDLDIHHRILRFQNYMVAFVNKDLFPLHVNVPFLGEVILLSQALQYNLEMILFWGPWSPFKSNWQLKEEYKKSGQRLIVANRLSRHILCVAIVNLLLSPVILIWQLLYFFFNYGQLIKNEPGALLGTRRWSPYARLYFRHYNELDHQLRARLARAYPHARKYMTSFVSPLAVVLAKNVCFFTGSILAVVILLTLIDEDVLLSTEHVLTFATVLGVIYGACRTLVLPWDEVETEGVPCCRQTLMDRILAHVHYLPADWMTTTPGAASRSAVRDAFSARFFELRVVHFLREALSALAVPYVLLVGVRPRALTIVDFLRNYTVEVEGVGDVCSFARMDPPTLGADAPYPSTQGQGSSPSSPIPEEGLASEDEERDEILGPLIGRRAGVGGAGKRSPRSLRVADKACSPLPPLDLEPPSSLTPAIPKTTLSLINFAVVDGGLTPTGPSARYMTGLKRQADSVFSGITRPDPLRVDDDDDPSGAKLSSVMASLVTMSTLGGGYTLVANDMLRNLPVPGVRPDDQVFSSRHVTKEKSGGEDTMGGSIWLPPTKGVTLSSYPLNPAVPHVMLHHSLIDLGRGGVGAASPSLVVPHTKNTVIPYSVIDMSLTVLYLHNKARNERASKQLKKQTSLEEPLKQDSPMGSPLFASMGKSVKFKDLMSATTSKIFENNEEKCPLLMKSFNPPKYDV